MHTFIATMDTQTKYYLINAAYRSRFLFRTDAEYREALGVAFDTIVNKRDSARDIDFFFDIFSRECEKHTDEPLEYAVSDYLEASGFYLSLDWGSRTQMASRKKFCRMLFRIAATAGKKLSAEEIAKFRRKDDDKRLIETFFPEGTKEEPVVNIGFIVLFAFGVIRPWDMESSRGRDISDEETVQALGRLCDLIEILMEDIPQLGSTEKPLAFIQWLEIAKAYLEDPEMRSEAVPLRLGACMSDIMRACRSLKSPKEIRIQSERFFGLDMNGIWIDDADGGETRFWIFPDIILAAFCYRTDGRTWELLPYDFKVREGANSNFCDTFFLLTPEGNLKYSMSTVKVLDKDQFISGSFEPEYDDATGEICRLVLYEEPCDFPAWLDWRAWERLNPDDEAYARFRDVLKDIYTPGTTEALFFVNTVPELTEYTNCIVGRDLKYIYLYDWAAGRFIMKEKSRDQYVYVPERGYDDLNKALFELEISESSPLYAIPLKVSGGVKSRNPETARFIHMLDDAESIPSVMIVHGRNAKYPRLIFPDYSVTVELNMEELAPLGVLKFTSRPF